MSNQPADKKSQANARPKIKLEFPKDLSPIYANTMIVSHTASEVILDVGQVMPHIPNCKIQARVVMTPVSAKMMLQTLAENLRRYENKYGEIKLPPTLADQLFSQPPPQGDSSEQGSDNG